MDDTRTVETKVTAMTDPETGDVTATAFFDTSAERIFTALTTREICSWWVRPGVFNTETWAADLREGGRWTAAGVGGGQPYQLEGAFVRIDAPRELVQTWKPTGAPIPPAMLSYRLDPVDEGVRLTLCHAGLPSADIQEKTRAGWETSLLRLQEIIRGEKG